MTLIRAVGAGAAATGQSTLTASVNLPAGIVAGDTVVVVVATTAYAGVAPTVAAANALALSFAFTINEPNTGRGTPSHTLAVFTLANATPAMSSQPFTAILSTGGQWISYTARAVAVIGPVLIAGAVSGDTGATGASTIAVPNLLGAASVDAVITVAAQMGMTSASPAPTFTTSSGVIVAQQNQASESYYGSGHAIIEAATPGAVTVTSTQTGTGAYAQLGLRALESHSGKGTLAAFGRIGGARGNKYIALTARVVSSAAFGQVATPGVASIVVPAGVVTGDTIVLVASVQAGAGPSVTRAATGPITTFAQVVDGRNTARAQSLSVFVLRNAAASLSGQSLSVQCDCTAATFYYVMQVYVFRSGDLPPYLVSSGDANSGTVQSTSVDIAKLTSDAYPINRILNVANTRNDSGSTAFTGSGLVGQSLYGSLGLMLGSGPAAGAYQYTASTPVSTVTAQVGFSTVKPVGWDNRHPLTAYGALTAGPGTAAVDPISIRVLAGGTLVKYYAANPWTITLPAGIKDGDTLVLAVVCCGQTSSVTRPTITEAAGFTQWTPLFNTPGPASSYHRTAAWAFHNAQASMSGTTVALTVNGAYEDSCSHRIMVLTPCRVIGKAATTGPATAGTDVTIANIQQDQDTRVVIAIIAAQNSGSYSAYAPLFLSPTIPVIEQTHISNSSHTNTNILTGWMRDPSVPAAFTAAPPGQPRYVVTGQIALSDIPLANYNLRGGGGGITGYARQVSRGGRMMLVRVSQNDLGPDTRISTPVPAGERIFWFLAVQHATVTATPPAGWTPFGYYANAGLQMWIFTRTYDPSMFNVAQNAAVSVTGLYWVSVSRVITGYAVSYDPPAFKDVNYTATTAQTVAMSPTATPGPRATMLSFYAATATGYTATSSTPYQSSGLQPFSYYSGYGANSYLFTSLTSAGVEQLWNPNSTSHNVRIIGQFALYDDSRYEAPRYVTGGAVTVTGYGKLTGKGRGGRPGKGGQLSGYGRLGDRGQQLIKVRYSGSVGGYSITLPASGIFAGDRMFMFLLVASTTVTATAPAGWVQQATFVNNGLSGWIFSRKYVAGDAGAVVTAGVSSTVPLWTVGVIAMLGGTVTFDAPILQSVDLSGTISTPFTLPATATSAGPRATMLSFYAALHNTTATGMPSVSASSGLNPMIFCTSSTSLHGQLFAALTSAGVTQQWLYGNGTTQQRQVGQIALYDPSLRLPPQVVTGRGGQLSGVGDLSARYGALIAGMAALAGGGQRIAPYRFADADWSYNPSYAIPAGLVPGDRMFYIMACIPGTPVTVTPQAGWTQIATFANGGVAGAILTATYKAGMPTINPGVSGGSMWFKQLLVMAGATVTYETPVLQNVNYRVTTGQAVTLPALVHPNPRSTVVSFFIATNSDRFQDIPTRRISGGVTPVNTAGWGSYALHPWLFSAVTSPGVTQQWNVTETGDVYQVGQIPVYDPSMWILPHNASGTGGQIVGWGKLAGHGRPGIIGFGGQITGEAVLKGRGWIPDPGLTGWGHITVDAGNVHDRRPIVRPGSPASASGEHVRYLRVPISRVVHVGDYLIVGVGVVGTARPITPPGWDRLQDTTAVAQGVTATVFGRTAGVYDPGGAVIIDTDTTINTVMSAALAAWKAPGVVSVEVYPQIVGRLPVRFGPISTHHGGNQRAVAGIAVSTSPGLNMQFLTPPANLLGADPATVHTQDSGGADPVEAVFIADYNAATELQGQVNSVVPAVACSVVVELVAVEHHEGVLPGFGKIHVERGEKLDPPCRINGYADIDVPAVEGHGVHNGAGSPRLTGYARMWLGPGIVADSFHGGRITAYSRLESDVGAGAHHSAAPQTLAAHGVLSSKRKRSGQGGSIAGEGVLHALAQHPWPNGIEGYARISAGGFAARFRHRPVSFVGYGRLIGGPGTKVTVLDPRYTQLRGFARISAQRGVKSWGRNVGVAVAVTLDAPQAAFVAAVILDDGPAVAVTLDDPAEVRQSLPVVADDGIAVPVTVGVKVNISVLQVGQVYRSRTVYDVAMRPTNAGHTTVTGG